MDYHEDSNEDSEKQKLEEELKCNDCDYIASRKDHLKFIRRQSKKVSNTYVTCAANSSQIKVESHNTRHPFI